MKFLALFCVVMVAATASPVSQQPFYHNQVPFGGYFGQGFNRYVHNQPKPVVQFAPKSNIPAVPQVPTPKPIAILKAESDVNPDGSYHYAYETENGIAVQEQGAQKQVGTEAGTVAQGSYEYVAPDGQKIFVQYIADENGFQPQGNALPVPPPVPEAILKSLEYNAAHPEENNYA